MLAAPAYEILISNSAPKEQLVIGDDNNKDSLYVRSKFFEQAVTLYDFVTLSTKQLNKREGFKRVELPRYTRWKEVQGFEKIKAACDFLGEADYHPGNLMVQNQPVTKGQDDKIEQQDNNNGDKLILTKIDHGRSFLSSNEDFDSFIISTDLLFKRLGYQQAINKGYLVFNIKKYSEALNDITSRLTEDRSDLNNRSNLKKDTIFDIALYNGTQKLDY